MGFNYLFQKSCLIYTRLEKSKLIFPSEDESQGLEYWIIWFIIFSIACIVLIIINRILKNRQVIKKKSNNELLQDRRVITERVKRSEYTADTSEKRKYYRISESIYVKFQLGYREQKCDIKDISGGGISFYTTIDPDKLKPSTLLGSMSFSLPGYGRILANSVVKRIIPLKDNDSGDRYICAVEFIHISDSNRELIIKYIHSKQRAVLRKSMSDDIEEND